MPSPKYEEPADERTRLLALAAEVGRALTTRRTLADMLRGCAQALVTHLDAAFARVWTLNAAEDTLELRASAGLYTHIDGPHGRVRVGQFKIGLIAQERRPHLTNAVVDDPRVSDQEWARREGMVAFAGYPLVVDERLIGVVAMFARRPLSELTLLAIGSVVDEIAIGIDRRRAEEALRNSEERYRTAFAHAAVGMALTDTTGRFLQVNDAYCTLTGFTVEELLQRDLAAVAHPDDRPRHLALLHRTLEGDTPSFVIEKRYVRKDGRTVWVQNSVSLVRDGEGNPANIITLTEDISERRRATEALRESEARKSAVLEVALDCIISIDGTGRIVEFNPAAERTFGHARAEVLGRPIAETIIPPSLRQAHRQGFSRYLATGRGDVVGRRVELTGMHKNGREFPVELAIVPLVGSDRTEFTAYLRDITERKEAEEAQAALFQHEHTIATQLQDALQPPVPGATPGIALQKYYEAALIEEAGVGGDFFDVFAIEKGCTALAVGDLSGKGLAAAAQVSTVRNMLRAFLYSKSTVGTAVTDLNRVLAENNLLTGFATLFVGAYDGGSRALNYVNCGQEPALVRRAATGAVEYLAPTGPILGMAEDAQFAEATVKLCPGDALAIFTDGLTEVGPSRRDMLGIEGMAALLAPAIDEGEVRDAGERAERLKQRLIAGVDAYAQGGRRDDICLLVGIVDGA